MRSLVLTVLAGIPLLFPATVRGATGDFDPAFGSGLGTVTEVEEDNNSITYSVLRQPDGKLVVAGFLDSATIGVKLALARYDTSGNLDPTFGSGGISLSALGGYYPYARSALLQPDGKIVIASRSSPGLVLARLNANGSLDSSFGTGGTVLMTLGPPKEEIAGAALQSDGKIVVAADTSDYFGPPSGDILVLRFDTDGSLDTSFGSNGVATIDYGGRRDDAERILVQPDDKIVVIGQSWDDPLSLPAGSSVTVARLEADGSPDLGFGNAGTFVHDFGRQDEAQAMTLLPDGKLLIAGTSYTWDGPHDKGGPVFFMRLTDAGALDDTFGVGGVRWPTPSPTVNAVSVAPDGKIVLIGTAGSTAFTLAMGIGRYHENGLADLSFGDGGVVVAILNQIGSNATAGLVEPDGNIIASGWSGEANAVNNPPYFVDYYFGIARFLGAAPCASDADCGPCESCRLPVGQCVFGPRTACTGALPGGATFSLDNPGIDRTNEARSFARHRLKFTWRGATPLDFDPLTTDDVGICLWMNGRQIMKSIAHAGGICGTKSCWRGTPGESASYRNAEKTPQGLYRVRLARQRIAIDGSGENLTHSLHGFPNPGVIVGGSLLVQVHGGNGACAQAELTEVKPKLHRFDNGYSYVGIVGTGQ